MVSTQLVTNYDVSQLFLGDNYYDSAAYTNSTGSTVTIQPGTFLGRVLSSAKVLPAVSTATDGSEYPMGIYSDPVSLVVLNGATVTINYCIAGRINQNKVIFYNGTDVLTTAVGAAVTGGGIMKDVIVRNTDLLLVPSVELTITDPNQ